MGYTSMHNLSIKQKDYELITNLLSDHFRVEIF